MKKRVLMLLLLVLPGCGDPEDQARILFQAAHQAMDRREPLEAETLLSRIERDYRETAVADQAIQTLRDYQSEIEGAAIEGLRGVNVAQAAFAAANDGRYGFSLTELVVAGLLNSELTAVTIRGYRYRTILDDEIGYRVLATPLINPDTKRHFYTDTTGVIRWKGGEPADQGSPAL